MTDAALDLAHPAVEPKPLARVYGEAWNELPRDLYIPPEALEVFLDTFEGPLDLLLYLIRRQNINVLDIPMAVLTRQYLGYVEMMFFASDGFYDLIHSLFSSPENAGNR